jgi:hypothetical protein
LLLLSAEEYLEHGAWTPTLRMDRGSAEAQKKSQTELPADPNVVGAIVTQMAPPPAAIDVMQLPS